MGKKHKSSSHHHHFHDHDEASHLPRRHSTDDHYHHKHKSSSDKHSSNGKSELVSKSTPTSPKIIETTLDLDDLGAGYTMEDKRVSRAVQYYEEILLPYIKENYDLFKSTNYLSIKGYGSGLKGNKRRAHSSASDSEDPNPSATNL